MAAEPHYIDVDLKKSTHYKTTTVTQNDTDVVFILRVSDDGRSDESVLDNFSTVTLTSQRRDGQSFYVLGEKIPGTNEVRFALGTKELELTGKVSASAQLYSVDGRQSSAKFNYNVEGDLTGDYVPTETEATLIEIVLMDGPATIAEAEQATAQTVEALELLDTEKTVAFQELDDVKEDNKLTWKPEVATVALRNSTYPNPQNGDTVRITEEARIDRFNGTEWITTDRYNPNALDLVHRQLAETGDEVQKVKERANTEIIANRNRRPMITIIDDDGRSDFLTTWKPILEEKEAKVSIGVVTSTVGTPNYMSWEELEQLKNELDVDLINHTHTHPRLGDLTEEELRYQFDESKKILKARGHNYDIMVYPYGSASTLSRKIAREYFRTGIYISGGVIVPPADTFMLNRVSLMPQTGAMESLETYKAYIDEAIAKNGWIIFMTHCFYPTWDAEKIKALIDYANSTNIEWVHTHEGLDAIGNVIDFGDYHYRAAGAEYTVMDANGVIHSSANSKDYVMINARNLKPVFGTPLTDFPIGLSTAVVQTAEASGFPVSGGMLETFRGGESGGILLYNYQVYHPYYSNKVFKRTWNRTNMVWSAFEEVGAGSTGGGTSGDSLHITSTTDAFTPTSSITSFTAGKITYTRISGTNSGITNFPDGEYGVLITNRLYTDGYAFQEYHTASGAVYYREWATSWSTWSRYIRGKTLKVTVPSITLAAGAVGDSSASVPEVEVTDIISGSPNTVLENGVMYSVLKQAGVIRVRFHNTTTSEITLAARNWNFTRVRSNEA